MIITKTRPSIYLCTACIVWSGVAAATIGVKSAQALWAVRFLLGIVEGKFESSSIRQCEDV